MTPKELLDRVDDKACLEFLAAMARHKSYSQTPGERVLAVGAGTGYGAAVPVTLDLGNGHYRIAFSVDRVHAGADAAALFLLNEMAKFTGSLDLKITVGAQVTYLAGTVLTECTPDPQSDQSTKIRYAFNGGLYTTTAP